MKSILIGSKSTQILISVFPHRNPRTSIVREEVRGKSHLFISRMSVLSASTTVRGDLVDTIEHHSTIDDGTENWDLRSKDGLNIAYGIYLFHIESPYGEKIGRFAVIK